MWIDYHSPVSLFLTQIYTWYAILYIYRRRRSFSIPTPHFSATAYKIIRAFTSVYRRAASLVVGGGRVPTVVLLISSGGGGGVAVGDGGGMCEVYFRQPVLAFFLWHRNRKCMLKLVVSKRTEEFRKGKLKTRIIYTRYVYINRVNNVVKIPRPGVNGWRASTINQVYEVL